MIIMAVSTCWVLFMSQACAKHLICIYLHNNSRRIILLLFPFPTITIPSSQIKRVRLRKVKWQSQGYRLISGRPRFTVTSAIFLWRITVHIRDDIHAICGGHKESKLHLVFKSHQAYVMDQPHFPPPFLPPSLLSNSTQNPFIECLHAGSCWKGIVYDTEELIMKLANEDLHSWHNSMRWRL